MPPCSSSGLKKQGKECVYIEITLLKAETNTAGFSDFFSLSQTQHCRCCSKGLLNQGNSGCVDFSEALDSPTVAGPLCSPTDSVPRGRDNDEQQGTGEKRMAWRNWFRS